MLLLGVCFFGMNNNSYCQTDNFECSRATFICSYDVSISSQTGMLADYFSGPYGCLGFSPNPSWAVFGTEIDGDIALRITTEDSMGNTNAQDIDFLVWGPFNSPDNVCSMLDLTNIIDCGYNTGSNNEVIRISGATGGSYYKIMFTNYTNNPGFIRLVPLPENTIELAGGFVITGGLEVLGKTPTRINLPSGVTPLSFKGSGITDTLMGIIEPCTIEGPGPHFVEIIGQTAFGCLDTVMVDISLCEDVGGIACLQNFTVTLDENCSARLDKCLVMEGECILGLDGTLGAIRIYASSDSLDITSFKVNVGVDDGLFGGVGQFYYGVYYEESPGRWQLFCNGVFFTEDYVDERFVGWNYQDTIFKQFGGYRGLPFYKISDSLVVRDDENYFNPKVWSCWQDMQFGNIPSSWVNHENYYWDTIKIHVKKTGKIQILAKSNSGEFIPLLALYQGENFNSTQPCSYLMSLSDHRQWTDLEHYGIEFMAQEGESYTALITHDRSLQSGKYFYELLLVDENNIINVNNSFAKDTFWSYFDFTRYDIDEFLKVSQQNIDFQNFIGGNPDSTFQWLGQTYADISHLDSAWYAFGRNLLGKEKGKNQPYYFINNNLDPGFFESLLIHHSWMPLLIENCSGGTIDISDNLIMEGDCEGQIIDRIFSSMNSTAHVQIHFRNATLEDIILPPFSLTFQCGEAISGGEPFLNSYFKPWPYQTINMFNGNISIGFDDGVILPGCGNNYSFFRKWTLVDWCRPSESLYFNQLIRVGDFLPPVWEKNSLKAESIQSDEGCEGGLSIMRGNATDGCSSVKISISVKDSLGNDVFFLNDTRGSDSPITILNLPLSLYKIQWMAADDCGQFIKDSIEISVGDQIGPVCIIDDEYVTSIQSAGDVKRISAESLDEGSYDACSPVNLWIRRLESESEWGEYIYVDCQDAGDYLDVQLMVEADGQSTVCSSRILVEDIQMPVCRNTDTLVIYCNDIPMNAENLWIDSVIMSQIDLEIGCNFSINPNYKTEGEIDNCGRGIINRFFTLFNQNNGLGDTCQAVIEIRPQWEYQIKFPADTILHCVSEPLKELEIENTGCGLITYSSNSEVLEGGQGCSLIRKSYKVINWCTYSDSLNAQPIEVGRFDLDENGLADGTLWKIKRNPSTDSDEISVQSFSLEDLSIVQQSMEEDSYLDAGTGFFQYLQIISIVDTTAPEIVMLSDSIIPSYSGEEEDCLTSVELVFRVSETCGIERGNIEIRNLWLDGEKVSNNMISEDSDTENLYHWKIEGLALKSYQIEMEVSDRCGNLSRLEQELIVKDLKGPAPLCIEGLSVSLSQDQTAIVFADDFVLNSPIFDCTGDSKDYSIVFLKNEDGKVKSREEILQNQNRTLLVGCGNVGLNEIAIIASDKSSEPNKDYCITTVRVLDGNGTCETNAEKRDISGVIRTADFKPVSGIEVILFKHEESIKTTKTVSSGEFTFSNISEQESYKVVPQSNSQDFLRGISTLDLVLMSRHILGIDPIKDPYNLIAADVNNSGSVTTLDVVILRQNLLLQRFDFAGNPSWRFIAGDKILESGNSILENSWSEHLEIDGKTSMDYSANFTAVKMGDVNGSAFQSVEARTNKSFPLTFEDRFIEKGERYNLEILVSSDFWNDMEGFQCGILFSGITIEDVYSEHIANHDFAIHKDSLLLVSAQKSKSVLWNHENIPLFQFSIIAEKSGFLKDFIKIDKTVLNPEAYSKNFEQWGIEIRPQFSDPSELKTIYPVPFVNELNIPFYANQSGRGELLITDWSGRTIFQKDINLDRGDNFLRISRNEFPFEIEKWLNLTLKFDNSLYSQVIVSGE